MRVTHKDFLVLPHVREHPKEETVGVAPSDKISFRDGEGRTRTLVQVLRDTLTNQHLALEVAESVPPVVVRGHLAWVHKETSPPLPVRVAFQSHQESGHVPVFGATAAFRRARRRPARSPMHLHPP